jgi:hypothetical protein
MNIGVSENRYTLLTATAIEGVKFDAQTFDVEVGHDMVGMTPVKDLPRPRPRYNRHDRIIPGSVTGFEQEMIFLMSTFSGTHSTEAGRYFVERLSRVTDTVDFTADGPLLANPSRIIMWPTHRPDVMESVNADFGSDVNWTFAYCNEDKSGVSDCLISATIIGSLHEREHSPQYSALYSTVLFDKPEKFVRPLGETLRAAIAACDEWAKYRREKRCDIIFICGFITFVILFFSCPFIYIASHQP